MDIRSHRRQIGRSQRHQNCQSGQCASSFPLTAAKAKPGGSMMKPEAALPARSHVDALRPFRGQLDCAKGALSGLKVQFVGPPLTWSGQSVPGFLEPSAYPAYYPRGNCAGCYNERLCQGRKPALASDCSKQKARTTGDRTSAKRRNWSTVNGVLEVAARTGQFLRIPGWGSARRGRDRKSQEAAERVLASAWTRLGCRRRYEC